MVVKKVNGTTIMGRSPILFRPIPRAKALGFNGLDRRGNDVVLYVAARSPISDKVA